MKDDRTDAEKYQEWVDAVNICNLSGWQCVGGWIFRAPGGTIHDLSGADLAQLGRIEEDGLFLADMVI